MLRQRFAIATAMLLLFASTLESSKAETVVVENLLISGTTVQVFCRNSSTFPVGKTIAPHQVATFEVPRNPSSPEGHCYGRFGRTLQFRRLYTETMDGQICNGKCLIIVSFNDFYRWNNVNKKWELPYRPFSPEVDP